MKKLFVLLFSSFILLGAMAQVDKGNLLIKNGTVITITKGNLEQTDVLIKDGKIAQIGKNITAPAGIKIVDASGHFVMPGIIDAHSHIALDGINEGTNPITPEVNESDVINPFQIGIYRALGGGITTVHAMHGSANAIGGQCETIKLRYGTFDPEVLKMEGAAHNPIATIKFDLNGEKKIMLNYAKLRIVG
jgi:imidazolonepropionase-like amidohydrolase